MQTIALFLLVRCPYCLKYQTNAKKRLRRQNLIYQMMRKKCWSNLERLRTIIVECTVLAHIYGLEKRVKDSRDTSFLFFFRTVYIHIQYLSIYSRQTALRRHQHVYA